MPHLRSIELREIPEGAEKAFPFSVPIIRALGRLDLDQQVTFLVGENGSGKSTLLEAIAAAAKLPTVGSQSIDRDETLAAQRLLARSLSF
ncbi:MAG TPA: AAA family ATPase, partial [Gemmatimonadaceae bacterium]|nr:AAA family ATPase [Gemmatimonadaceae bacterium]